MSVSTNAEMRLRGRRPSDAPKKALARVLRLSARGKRHKRLLDTGGHLGTPRKEAGVSAFHHVVFAAATEAAYARLHARASGR